MSTLAPTARRICEITSGGVIGPRWTEDNGARHALELAKLCLCAVKVKDVGGMRAALNPPPAFAYGVPWTPFFYHDALKLRQSFPALRRLLLRSCPHKLMRLARLFAKQSAFIEREPA